MLLGGTVLGGQKTELIHQQVDSLGRCETEKFEKGVTTSCCHSLVIITLAGMESTIPHLEKIGKLCIYDTHVTGTSFHRDDY